jgi:hypothetical protein
LSREKSALGIEEQIAAVNQLINQFEKAIRNSRKSLCHQTINKHSPGEDEMRKTFETLGEFHRIIKTAF